MLKSSLALPFSRTQKVVILHLWIASDVLVIHQRAWKDSLKWFFEAEDNWGSSFKRTFREPLRHDSCPSWSSTSMTAKDTGLQWAPTHWCICAKLKKKVFFHLGGQCPWVHYQLYFSPPHHLCRDLLCSGKPAQPSLQPGCSERVFSRYLRCPQQTPVPKSWGRRWGHLTLICILKVVGQLLLRVNFSFLSNRHYQF